MNSFRQAELEDIKARIAIAYVVARNARRRAYNQGDGAQFNDTDRIISELEPVVAMLAEWWVSMHKKRRKAAKRE